jgi:hypothetical protein
VIWTVVAAATVVADAVVAAMAMVALEAVVLTTDVVGRIVAAVAGDGDPRRTDGGHRRKRQ